MTRLQRRSGFAGWGLPLWKLEGTLSAATRATRTAGCSVHDWLAEGLAVGGARLDGAWVHVVKKVTGIGHCARGLRLRSIAIDLPAVTVRLSFGRHRAVGRRFDRADPSLTLERLTTGAFTTFAVGGLETLAVPPDLSAGDAVAVFATADVTPPGRVVRVDRALLVFVALTASTIVRPKARDEREAHEQQRKPRANKPGELRYISHHMSKLAGAVLPSNGHTCESTRRSHRSHHRSASAEKPGRLPASRWKCGAVSRQPAAARAARAARRASRSDHGEGR
jgi:hypothetical protein